MKYDTLRHHFKNLEEMPTGQVIDTLKKIFHEYNHGGYDKLESPTSHVSEENTRILFKSKIHDMVLTSIWDTTRDTPMNIQYRKADLIISLSPLEKPTHDQKLVIEIGMSAGNSLGLGKDLIILSQSFIIPKGNIDHDTAHGFQFKTERGFMFELSFFN